MFKFIRSSFGAALTSVVVAILCATAILQSIEPAHAAAVRFQEYTTTHDFGNLIDAAGESVSIATVDQAVPGDACLVSLGVSTQGITLTCNVTAARTVIVRAQNETGGALDLASTTVRVFLLKRHG